MSSTVALIRQYGIVGNLAQIARDFLFTKFNCGTNYQHDYLSSPEHPPSLVLDCSITNNEATTQTVYLDGVPLNIGTGRTVSLSNTPFVSFRCNGNIDITTAGVNLSTLRSFRK